MRAQIVLLPFVLAVIFLSPPPSAAAADKAARKALAGGWSPIKNLGDPHVHDIAEYALAEHNKEAKTGLVFSRVIRGETQVVAGTNYRLVIKTKDGGDYEAVVWEKTWEHFRQLTSFKPVKA